MIQKRQCIDAKRKNVPVCVLSSVFTGTKWSIMSTRDPARVRRWRGTRSISRRVSEPRLGGEDARRRVADLVRVARPLLPRAKRSRGLTCDLEDRENVGADGKRRRHQWIKSRGSRIAYLRMRWATGVPARPEACLRKPLGSSESRRPIPRHTVGFKLPAATRQSKFRRQNRTPSTIS